MHAREHLDDVELHGVGILKFVDVDIAELARKIFPRLLVGSKQRARLGEKVVKVERVVLLQVLIVLFVDLHRLFDIALRAVLRGVLRGREPQHLGVGDMPLDALQEAVLFEVQLLEGLFDDGGALLLGIDGKVLREPPALGIHPQDAHTHGVDGAHPHPPRIGDGGKALFHLVRRLVGEGDGKDILGRHAHIPHEVGDARRQNARLAAARPREHQNGPSVVSTGSRCSSFKSKTFMEDIISYPPRFDKRLDAAHTPPPANGSALARSWAASRPASARLSPAVLPAFFVRTAPPA